MPNGYDDVSSYAHSNAVNQAATDGSRIERRKLKEELDKIEGWGDDIIDAYWRAKIKAVFEEPEQ